MPAKTDPRIAKMKTLKDGFLVGPVRLSYLTVFEPKMGLKKVQYSVTLMIPKDPGNTFCPHGASERQELFEALKTFATNAFGAANLKGLKMPLKDGDLGVDGGDPPMPGYWLLRTAANPEYPPLLLDGQRKIVTGGWKSGDWALAKIGFWKFTNPESRGVSANILGLQFLHHDEALSGAAAATVDDFEVVETADAAEGGAPIEEEDPFAD